MAFTTIRATTMPSAPRFEDLTETTGIPLSQEGASMMSTRYALGAGLADGRSVLELGCGAGQGLRLLGAQARSVVGGDYSAALLHAGREHYGPAMPLVRLSADHLPFADAAFDLILMFESSYYVPDMAGAFDDLARVLAPGGTVVFVNANPERPDFIRSPHSVHYHTADEFRQALTARGFRVTTEGAFPLEPPAKGMAARAQTLVLRAARRVLDVLHLVPRTLRGRARLKRLVYGRLTGVPPELPADYAPVAPRTALVPGPVRTWKVLYVTAARP